jgi:SpoVK/Ycf46/Vps4 family AAA+-type ATPase
MAGLGEHIKALVRNHASGNDDAFYSIALQAAASEARHGHHVVANDIKKVVDASRGTPARHSVTRLPRSRDQLEHLMEESHSQVKMRELVAPPELGDQIKQVIAEQRQRETLLNHGFAPVHRLLLEGPPGTGKTMTASVLANELSLPMYTLRLDSLLSKYLGETASKLRLVFDAIAERRGVYLFDEFDALGADRAGNDVGEARRILSSFLVFLEQASCDSLVIAATNHRSIIDRAMFRRFDMILTYDLPDARHAVTVLRSRLGSLGTGLSFAKLDSYTQGLSHADLVRAAEGAAKEVLMRNDTRVTREDLVKALSIRRQASIG